VRRTRPAKPDAWCGRFVDHLSDGRLALGELAPRSICGDVDCFVERRGERCRQGLTIPLSIVMRADEVIE
jgi:hypothetical protein